MSNFSSFDLLQVTQSIRNKQLILQTALKPLVFHVTLANNSNERSSWLIPVAAPFSSSAIMSIFWQHLKPRPFNVPIFFGRQSVYPIFLLRELN